MAEESLIEQIRQRAYEIWLGEGRPHGRDRMHWLRAEGEFREKFSPEQSDKAVLPKKVTGSRKRQGPRRKD